MKETTPKTPKGATEDGRHVRMVRCDRCHEVTHYKMGDGHLITVLYPRCKCDSPQAPDAPGLWMLLDRQGAREVVTVERRPEYDGGLAWRDWRVGLWRAVTVHLMWAGRWCEVRVTAKVRFEPCPMCSRPIFSVRKAIAETDLPGDTGTAEAIRELWRRLTVEVTHG